VQGVAAVQSNKSRRQLVKSSKPAGESVRTVVADIEEHGVPKKLPLDARLHCCEYGDCSQWHSGLES